MKEDQREIGSGDLGYQLIYSIGMLLMAAI